MNKKEVYCINDKFNDCYAISTDKYVAIADRDIAFDVGCEEEQDYNNYFNLLIKYGAFELNKEAEFYGFDSREDCQRCVDAINQAENIQELFKDMPMSETKIKDTIKPNNKKYKGYTTMYFITGIREFDEKYGAKGTRCFGYRTEFNVTELLVLNNACDINETIYDYVVIEEISEGIHPSVENEWFYKFDYEKGYYEPIEKPAETEHFCNYSLG